MLDELLRELRNRAAFNPREVNNIPALQEWAMKRARAFERRSGRDWADVIGEIEIYLITNAVYYVWRNVPLPPPHRGDRGRSPTASRPRSVRTRRRTRRPRAARRGS